MGKRLLGIFLAALALASTTSGASAETVTTLGGVNVLSGSVSGRTRVVLDEPAITKAYSHEIMGNGRAAGFILTDGTTMFGAHKIASCSEPACVSQSALRSYNRTWQGEVRVGIPSRVVGGSLYRVIPAGVYELFFVADEAPATVTFKLYRAEGDVAVPLEGSNELSEFAPAEVVLRHEFEGSPFPSGTLPVTHDVNRVPLLTPWLGAGAELSGGPNGMAWMTTDYAYEEGSSAMEFFYCRYHGAASEALVAPGCPGHDTEERVNDLPEPRCAGRAETLPAHSVAGGSLGASIMSNETCGGFVAPGATETVGGAVATQGTAYERSVTVIGVAL